MEYIMSVAYLLRSWIRSERIWKWCMHGNISKVVVQKFSIFFLIGLSSLLESSDWDSLERTIFRHFVCAAVFCFWFVWFSVLKHWKCVGLLGVSVHIMLVCLKNSFGEECTLFFILDCICITGVFVFLWMAWCFLLSGQWDNASLWLL